MPEEKKLSANDMEVIGTIYTAMVKDSQWVQNQVEQNYIREIESWREAFLTLFANVKEANQYARNMDISDALWHSSYLANEARRPGWWSPDFRKNF